MNLHLLNKLIIKYKMAFTNDSFFKKKDSKTANKQKC